MSSGNQVKRIVTHAEPIPEELKSLSNDLSTFYASEGKVEKELPLNFAISEEAACRKKRVCYQGMSRVLRSNIFDIRANNFSASHKTVPP